MASKKNRVKELAKSNPQVDLKQATDAIGALDQIRKLGFSPRSEGIVPPYDRSASIHLIKQQENHQAT